MWPILQFRSQISLCVVLELKACDPVGVPRHVGVVAPSVLRRELDAVLGAWLPRRGLRGLDLREEACWGLSVNNGISAACSGFGVAAVWQWRVMAMSKAG